MSERSSGGRYRGKHPRDASLFGAEQQRAFEAAVKDLSWLLSQGYAEKSALKLVGDRYALVRRQRIAVARCSASDEALTHGTDRAVEEMPRAIELVGRSLELAGSGNIHWYLDPPVSNSGRLKVLQHQM